MGSAQEGPHWVSYAICLGVLALIAVPLAISLWW